MFKRLTGGGRRPPTQPQQAPEPPQPKQASWPGQKKPAVRNGPSEFSQPAGPGGPAKPPPAQIAPQRPAPQPKPMPPGSEKPLQRQEGALGYGVPTNQAPPLRQPPRDPAVYYRPDQTKMGPDGKYSQSDQALYGMNARGNRDVFNTPEHNRPTGTSDMTARQSAQTSMHDYMRKPENGGLQGNQESMLASREVNGRLYPNQPNLAYGTEKNVRGQPGMFPDGTAEVSHTHVSPSLQPGKVSTADRRAANYNITNANHGPNTNISQEMMLDRTPGGGGKNYGYDGTIKDNPRNGKEFAPYQELRDPYKVQVPPGTAGHNRGVEIPVLKPLPPAQLPPA